MHCHALIICQLSSCNLFTQHVSYLLWRDTTSELWTPVHFLILIKPPTAIICSLLLSALITVFHTIRLILCFQQAGEIDNLSVSLGQSSLLVLCAGSTSVAPLTTFWRTSVSSWFDKPWSYFKGKLLLHYIIPSSWGLPTNVCCHGQQADLLVLLLGSNKTLYR